MGVTEETVPDRLVRRAWITWKRFPQEVLLILLAITLCVAIWGWSKAGDAQQTLANQQAVADQGKRISQVVTCFNAARSRPLLTRILRGLASRESDQITRQAYGVLIDDYERQPVVGIEGAPTRDKCAKLGDMLHVDYSSMDFDPKTGRLLDSSVP